ncbi:beta-ketoacyl-ACP synthase III [Peptococcaceae bacterium 1198_IL3148]
MSQQQIIQAGILGVGSYLPERILTNRDLEKMVETSDDWIVSRTGIKERRVAAEEQLASDLATEAGNKALKDAGISGDEVDLIIVATSTPDMYFPSTACIVQDKLGCPKAAAFDLSAACSGFIYAMTVAQQFIGTGAARYVLVIGAEVLTRVTNWQDRSTCVLFGDGAGAVVMGPVAAGNGILSSKMAAEGAGRECLTLPCARAVTPFSNQPSSTQALIAMQGKEVFKYAVRVMVDGAREVLEQANLTTDDIALFIPHQANIRIIEHAAKKLDLPQEKVFANVDKYGNTSAASVPIALDEAYRQGRIKSGDKIILIGFGGGLTWSAAVVKWQ